MSDLVTDMAMQIAQAKTIMANQHAEILRLHEELNRIRSMLVDANNRWRHDFSNEVEDAADKLFKKLAAFQTKPFGTRERGADVEREHATEENQQ